MLLPYNWCTSESHSVSRALVRNTAYYYLHARTKRPTYLAHLTYLCRQAAATFLWHWNNEGVVTQRMHYARRLFGAIRNSRRSSHWTKTRVQLAVQSFPLRCVRRIDLHQQDEYNYRKVRLKYTTKYRTSARNRSIFEQDVHTHTHTHAYRARVQFKHCDARACRRTIGGRARCRSSRPTPLHDSK